MNNRRLLEGIIIAIAILLGLMYKEDIANTESDDARYVHPSSIYDSRDIRQSTEGDNSPAIIADTITITYE